MGSIGSGRELRPTPPLSAPGRLVIAKPIPLDRCPAAVYLAQLKQSSRRPQKQALDLAASILTSGSADCLTLDWSVVRYQHTAAVRARLLDGYAPLRQTVSCRRYAGCLSRRGYLARCLLRTIIARLVCACYWRDASSR